MEHVLYILYFIYGFFKIIIVKILIGYSAPKDRFKELYKVEDGPGPGQYFTDASEVLIRTHSCMFYVNLIRSGIRLTWTNTRRVHF